MATFFSGLLKVLTLPLRLLLLLPGQLVGGSGRFARTSLPFRVALLMFLVLVVSVAVTVFLFCGMNNRTFTDAKLNITFFVSTTVLVFLIPLVLYKALSLWLEGPSSPYPDIDQAWKAGLRELQRKGLDPRQIPMFLVVGSSNEQQEQAIFAAAGMEFLVAGAAGQCGPALVREPRGRVRRCQPDLLSQRTGARRCAWAGSWARAARGGGRGSGGARSAPNDPRWRHGPSGASRYGRSRRAGSAPGPCAPVPQGGADLRGTIMAPAAAGATMAVPGGQALDRNIQTDKAFLEEQRNRLGWLCRLVRRCRLPYAPINGVLALLPFGYVQSAQPGVRTALTNSLRYDLEQVLSTLMIRCPVTVLVSDMDEDPGFREFVRRMVRRHGPEWVKERRFGSSFPLDIPATPERMKKHVGILNAAFEAFVYDFLRDEESILRSAGNASLYVFMGKIRQSVKNLATIFGSFSSLYPKSSGGSAAAAEIIYFAGCYFAGTGKVEERQVFVKRVLARPVEQQAELEWTAGALGEDARCQWLGLVASAVDTVLVIAFVVAGVLWWMGSFKPS